MPNAFEHYTNFYNQLYFDKDYESEVRYLTNLIRKHKPESREILEFGSGTGIHGRLLGAEEFIVTGVEPSQNMLDNSTDTENFKNSLGDLRVHFSGLKAFDVCLVLFHVYNYLITDEEQQAAFKNIRSNLKPGGLVAVEVWHGPAVDFQKPETRVKAVQNDDYEICRIAVPSLRPNNVVDVTYDIFYRENQSDSYNRLTEVHSLRPTHPEELHQLASLNGFSHVLSEEFLTGSEASLDSWSVLHLYRLSNSQ
jgi:SAM-dependent methyltransferase